METNDGEGGLNPLRGPWAALAAPADGTPGGLAVTRSGFQLKRDAEDHDPDRQHRGDGDSAVHPSEPEGSAGG